MKEFFITPQNCISSQLQAMYRLGATSAPDLCALTFAEEPDLPTYFVWRIDKRDTFVIVPAFEEDFAVLKQNNEKNYRLVAIPLGAYFLHKDKLFSSLIDKSEGVVIKQISCFFNTNLIRAYSRLKYHKDMVGVLNHLCTPDGEFLGTFWVSYFIDSLEKETSCIEKGIEIYNPDVILPLCADMPTNFHGLEFRDLMAITVDPGDIIEIDGKKYEFCIDEKKDMLFLAPQQKTTKPMYS